MVRSDRNLPAAVILFFVAPFVAEFLLGNLPLKLLPAMIVLAPMYGGAALLIREMVRRAGRGWPSILVLGAAYGLLEEGFATQSLFNPDYLRLHMHFLAPAHVAAWGIGGWWTVFMLNLHTFWSIGVSVALVEGLIPRLATRRWLGGVGQAIVAVLFVLGVAANMHFSVTHDPFLASPAQFATTGVLILLLIAVAFLLPRSPARNAGGAVPPPWVTGAIAFVLGVCVLLVQGRWGWGAVATMLGLDLVFLLVVGVLSRRAPWTPLHTLSMGAGGALAYGLHAFFEMPAVGGGGVIVRVGNVIFLAIALALIGAGVARSAAASEPMLKVADR